MYVSLCLKQAAQLGIQGWPLTIDHIYIIQIYIYTNLSLSSSIAIYVCLCLASELTQTCLPCPNSVEMGPYWNTCRCSIKIWHLSRYQISQVNNYESRHPKMQNSHNYIYTVHKQHHKAYWYMLQNMSPPGESSIIPQEQPPNSACRHRFSLLWRLLWRQFTW